MRRSSVPLEGPRGQMPSPGYPTVEVVALALRVCPATVWRLVKLGKLKTRRFMGRTVFDSQEVETLSAERSR